MKITIIGCGNMGSKIARRLSQSHQMTLYDRNQEKMALLADELKAKSAKNIEEAVKNADIVLLAIKPTQLEEISSVANRLLDSNQLVVSILGGINHETLRKAFTKAQLLLMMPNTPCLYGQGVIGLAVTPETNDEIKTKAEAAFSSLGELHWIPDHKMNALAALAGSGPAFVFVMIESVIDAGIAMGLSSEQSKQMALQMISGSITLMKETKKSPSELKWQVTSPGGTTIAGIEALENHAVRAGIMNTFLATYQATH